MIGMTLKSLSVPEQSGRPSTYRVADLKAKATKKANDAQFGELIKKTSARAIEEIRLIETRVRSPTQSRPRN